MQTLVIVAMRAEADPVMAALGLGGDGVQLHPAFPARLWQDDQVAVAVNGTDTRFGVDSIATQPAVTTTLHAVERVEPTMVISAGTAGGFAERGGRIGSIYLANRCVFHDRRVAVPGFEPYGDGDYPVADLAQLAQKLGFEQGTVSTGNAIDAPPVDMAKMLQTRTVAKDMEAAAVAWTCERLEVPFTALKVITDLVDTGQKTAEQFQRNLQTATSTLAQALAALVAELRDR